MKVGIISDIHSNFRALKVCLDYFEKEQVDYYLFLGDYVSDTPYPQKVLGMLRDFKETHNCRFLRGNREDYFLNHRKNDAHWTNNSASGNLKYTYECLTAEDLDFFESLPITFRFEEEGYPSITCCHGSPTSTRELLYYDRPNLDEYLENLQTDYLIGGHSHQRISYEHAGRTYINTGSCGISIHNAGCAECVLLTGFTSGGQKQFRYDFLSLPYDVNALVADIFESGQYDAAPWFMNANIQTLTTGADRAYLLTELAEQKQKAIDGRIWPDISEECYQEAAQELGIPDYSKNRSPVIIRRATPEDAPFLQAIYAPYVTETAVSFEYEAPSVTEFRDRIIEKKQKYPYLVAVLNGEPVGYIYASPYRTRAAYAWDVELSIYIKMELRRSGIGSLLVYTMEDALVRMGVLNVYAIVVASDDPKDPYVTDASFKFHTHMGYKEEGRLKGVGNKFGRFYDTVFLVKHFKQQDGKLRKPEPYFLQ